MGQKKIFIFIFFASLTVQASLFEMEYEEDPFRPRSIFWGLLSSSMFPGFDQWYEGQTEAAYLYSGLAVGGLGLAASGEAPESDLQKALAEDKKENSRRFLLGLQIYNASGSLSAYHSFRSSIKAYQVYDRFSFLEQEERVDDLLLAPFQFKYFKDPRVYWPLGVFFVGAVAAANDSQVIRGVLTGSDAIYTGAISFNAGVHEEAMFRGVLMPLFQDSWGSEFWSKSISALLFGLAHYSESNRAPLFQALSGYYLGDMVVDDQWTLSRAIFLHAWWDVIALAAAFSLKEKETVIWLPSLYWTW